MSHGPDLGGDPPCWAHLFEPGVPACDGDAPVYDLGASSTDGRDGAVWSLPHRGELDANLVRLTSGGGIAEHRNDDVDVLIFVQSGAGELSIDGVAMRLAADHLALVPRGASRSISAGAQGLTYLSIHRRRGPLSIAPRTKRG